MADKPNITINITGANPQIYPSAEQITHNHYYGDQFAEDAIKANKKEILLNQEAKEEKEAPDALQAILGDRQLYDDVVYWASTCERPKDIANRVAPILKKNGFNRFNKAFVEALLPHLTQYTGGTNHYKNMLRLFY